jgi:DNA repair photolyase
MEIKEKKNKAQTDMSNSTISASTTKNHIGTIPLSIDTQKGTQFSFIAPKPACYDLENFAPLTIDKNLLVERGIDYTIHSDVAAKLVEGSEWFNTLYESKNLTPGNHYVEGLTDINEELEIHNYTGMCPTNVLEVSPSGGSCAVACQYCLVTDGNHVKPITVYTNYTEKLANSLERNCDKPIFYYFSPKTEAFSEPHLYNGLAHDIMQTFVKHFDKHPDSALRVFIATKAGPRHMQIKHNGDSLFDVMGRIASKIQVNGSIGIMPKYLQDVLEPNAATVAERLEVLVQCRELGMSSESVLCQPLLLPYLTDENISTYMGQLKAAGVINIKPEFLTTEIRNLVILAQYINHFEPKIIGEFFHPYLGDENQDHIKQRSRLAPRKDVCVKHLENIRDIAKQHGITISICNWVKRELSIEAEWVKTVDHGSAANGYRCLGYQTNLFPK